MAKKIIKTILSILIALIGVVCLYFIFMTVTDYKPKDKEKLQVVNQKNEKVDASKELSILTFNIGYGGMDKDVDFFMDGGTGSRSISKEKTEENLNGLKETIKGENTDFVIIQEVDESATRSYHIDELKYFRSMFNDYSSTFAYNYKVPWVPVPITKPMGSVKAGLLTLSKYSISDSSRFTYPGQEKWPMYLADLDRCFIESRISLDNGKELIIINSHLSAYDKGGVIRKQQLGFLKKHITDEYNKGNYVLVGGDWNHLIPTTDPSLFKTNESWPDWLQKIPDDFKPENFSWSADKSVPTTRSDDMPYKKDYNFLAVIDGYLSSPNIQINKVEGLNKEFRYTDHNPVKLNFILK